MPQPRGAHPLTPAVWAATIALVALGVFAGGGRALHVGDWVARIEPVRTTIYAFTGTQDPLAASRERFAREVDGSFAARPATTRWHVIAGAIFLLVAPLQFSRRMRKRYAALHRWTGRALLILGGAAAVTGLYFGLFAPYAGNGERVVVGSFGLFFLVSAGIAYAAARRRDIDRHREWIIRAFAAGIAISTIRVVAMPLDLMLTPRGFTPKEIFVRAMASGWVITLLLTELWLSRTRRRGTVPA